MIFMTPVKKKERNVTEFGIVHRNIFGNFRNENELL